MSDTYPQTRDDGKRVLDVQEGRDVVGCSVAIRKAGDGLSKALNTDETILRVGETAYVVLECDVDHLEYPRAEGTKEAPSEDLVRRHVLYAGAATIVDRSIVEAHLNSTKERIAEAEARAEAQRTLMQEAEEQALAEQEAAAAASESAQAQEAEERAGANPHEWD